MRPTVKRPNLALIHRHFEHHLKLLKSDAASFAAGKQLRRLLLDGYLSLVHMKDAISYSEWAGHVLIVVRSCGGLILKMKLMRHIFDLIFSFHCGYVGYDEFARLKYQNRYGSTSTTFKDVYDIAKDFNDSWGEANAVFETWGDNNMADTVDLLEALKLPAFDINAFSLARDEGLDQDFEKTAEYLVAYLWRSARVSYYRLRYLGCEVAEYDVVFQQKKPPFPRYVFFDLLGRLEDFCRWLPVGTEGLFSEESRQNYPLKFLLEGLASGIAATGIATAPWQKKCVSDDDGEDENTTPKIVGEGRVRVGYKDTLDHLQGFIKKWKISQKYPADAVNYLAKTMDAYGFLDMNFFDPIKELEAELTMEPFLCNPGDIPELVDDIKEEFFDTNDFHALCQQNFFILECLVEGKFHEPKTPPFKKALRQMQLTKEFLFFRSILQARAGDPRGGLFIQSCIDYSNRVDPLIQRKGDDWITFQIVDMDGREGAIVNDPKYIVANFCDDESVHSPAGFGKAPIKATGQMCFGFYEEAEPMLAETLYCEGATGNALSVMCYNLIKDAIPKDPVSNTVTLPFLTVQDDKVCWRGHQVTETSLDYWHENLGHLNLKGLKRYTRVVGGMPPYFWPFKISCPECYGEDD
ncbi:hypothetical protein CJU89_5115 [Yarrowia sp. B02]|nr:hypothetical protein CJU89_5115 [Yarrowia sp. B02]